MSGPMEQVFVAETEREISIRRRRAISGALIGSAVLVGVFALVSFVGPFLVANPSAQDLAAGYMKPFGLSGGTVKHLLGTDQLGRDILARSVFGLRSSGETGLLAVGIGAVFGIPVGLVAGYRGGWLDEVVMRLVDVQLAIPNIMLLLLVVSVLQPSFGTVVVVLALLAWVVYVRVARAEVLALKQQDMVVGLVAMGASPIRVVFRHVLANIAGPLIVVTNIEFAHVVIAGAALSYLGLGIPPPDPTLGGMISDGQGGLTAALWWPVVMPGALLTVLVLSISGLGESLRVRLDPRSRVRAARPWARRRRAASRNGI